MTSQTLIDRILEESPNLWIVMAAGQGRLPSHREVLQMHCTCVKGLPPGDTWDVSALVIDGKPVQRAVAIAWLQVVYLAGDDEKQQDPVNLADLLAFADAVGSTRGVMKACMHSLPGSLTITVNLAPRQQQQQQQQVFEPPAAAALHHELELEQLLEHAFQIQHHHHLDELEAVTPPASLIEASSTITFDVDGGRAYYFQGEQLRSDNISSVICMAEMDYQQFCDAGRQLAAQLEVLLYQAYNLQLLDLQQRLHNFIFSSSLYGVGILPRKLLDDVVFSPRVMAAVGVGPGPMHSRVKAAWIDSLLVQAFGTVGDNHLVELTDPAAYDAAMPKMEGVLKRPFLGTEAGTWFDFQPQLMRISSVGNASTTPGMQGVMPLRLVMLCDAHSLAAGNYQLLEMPQ